MLSVSYNLTLSLSVNCFDFKPNYTTDKARLDLRQDAQGLWHAVVSFEGHTPAAFVVTETSTSLLLDGMALVDWMSPFVSQVEDHTWLHLDIPKNAAGGPGAIVHAKGSLYGVDGGDAYCGNVMMKGEGELVADTSVPTAAFEIAPLPGRLFQVLLPWDPLILHLSEPLDPVALQSAITASATVGGTTTALSMPWTLPTPDSPEAISSAALWAGTHQLISQGSWPDGAALQLSVGTGLADPSGNPLDVVSGASSVVDVGPAQPSIDFDTAPSGLWGGVKYLPAGEGSECESGGCVELSKSKDFCPLPLAGMAVRLKVPVGATQLHLRVRLSRDDGESSYYYESSTFLEMRADGKTAPLENIFSFSPLVFEPLESPDPPLVQRTPWLTRSLELPALGPDRVVELAIFKGWPRQPGCVFGAPKLTTRVIIDRIWTD